MTFQTSTADRYFYAYFVHQLANPLRIISPSRSWVDLALQLSTHDRTVYYTIAALASINRARNQVTATHHPSLSKPAWPRWYSVDELAVLKQYCKASTALQRYINNAIAGQASLEPLLVCCILLIIYEIFEERPNLALLHLRLGRRSLEALVHSFKPALTNATTEIMIAFDWMEGEVVHSGANRSFYDEEAWNSTYVLDSFPASFLSLQDAKETLVRIISASSRVRLDLVQLAQKLVTSNPNLANLKPSIKCCIAYCISRIIDLSLHPEILIQAEHFIKVHEAWLARLKAYSPKVLRHVAPDTEAVRRNLILMEIQHFYTLHMLTTLRNTRSVPTDVHFRAHYSHVLDLIDDYLTSSSIAKSTFRPLRESDGDMEKEPQRTFSLESTLLPTLHLICIQCRISSIRQRALHLLRHADRREGVHWSRELAIYADTITDIEQRRVAEIGLTNQGADKMWDMMPEAGRFCDVVIEGINYQHIRVIAGRFRHEDTGELELVEYRASGLHALSREFLGTIRIKDFST